MTSACNATAGRRAFLLGAGAAALGAAAPLLAPALAASPPEREPRFDQGFRDRVAARVAGLEQLHGMMVAHDGRTVLAEAFRGPPLDRLVNVKSVSKTLVAALTGAALDQGVLDAVDQRLGELAPDLIPSEADARVQDITVADLLTMQAGLERTSGRNYGRWVTSDDWIAFALSRRFVAEPGAFMLYSTGSYHVLGAVLAERAGRSLLDMARAWLGRPLGIEIPPWTQDPQGFYLGGNNMALSPEGLLRFGEMFRHGGLSGGRRVLSEAWVRTSWRPRTRSPFSGHDYGYGWFLAQAGSHQVAYARGYGGQLLYVVPSLRLTVVITSDTDRPARSRGYAGQLNDLLAEVIMPAAGMAAL
jgi:CubicO group peptidase (beta-lactamase class C family)